MLQFAAEVSELSVEHGPFSAETTLSGVARKALDFVWRCGALFGQVARQRMSGEVCVHARFGLGAGQVTHTRCGGCEGLWVTVPAGSAVADALGAAEDATLGHVALSAAARGLLSAEPERWVADLIEGSYVLQSGAALIELSTQRTSTGVKILVGGKETAHEYAHRYTQAAQDISSATSSMKAIPATTSAGKSVHYALENESQTGVDSVDTVPVDVLTRMYLARQREPSFSTSEGTPNEISTVEPSVTSIPASKRVGRAELLESPWLFGPQAEHRLRQCVVFPALTELFAAALSDNELHSLMVDRSKQLSKFHSQILGSLGSSSPGSVLALHVDSSWNADFVEAKDAAARAATIRLFQSCALRFGGTLLHVQVPLLNTEVANMARPRRAPQPASDASEDAIASAPEGESSSVSHDSHFQPDDMTNRFLPNKRGVMLYFAFGLAPFSLHHTAKRAVAAAAQCIAVTKATTLSVRTAVISGQVHMASLGQSARRECTLVGTSLVRATKLVLHRHNTGVMLDWQTHEALLADQSCAGYWTNCFSPWKPKEVPSARIPKVQRLSATRNRSNSSIGPLPQTELTADTMHSAALGSHNSLYILRPSLNVADSSFFELGWLGLCSIPGALELSTIGPPSDFLQPSHALSRPRLRLRWGTPDQLTANANVLMSSISVFGDSFTNTGRHWEAQLAREKLSCFIREGSGGGICMTLGPHSVGKTVLRHIQESIAAAMSLRSISLRLNEQDAHRPYHAIGQLLLRLYTLGLSDATRALGGPANGAFSFDIVTLEQTLLSAIDPAFRKYASLLNQVLPVALEGDLQSKVKEMKEYKENEPAILPSEAALSPAEVHVVLRKLILQLLFGALFPGHTSLSGRMKPAVSPVPFRVAAFIDNAEFLDTKSAVCIADAAVQLRNNFLFSLFGATADSGEPSDISTIGADASKRRTESMVQLAECINTTSETQESLSTFSVSSTVLAHGTLPAEATTQQSVHLPPPLKLLHNAVPAEVMTCMVLGDLSDPDADALFNSLRIATAAISDADLTTPRARRQGCNRAGLVTLKAVYDDEDEIMVYSRILDAIVASSAFTSKDDLQAVFAACSMTCNTQIDQGVLQSACLVLQATSKFLSTNAAQTTPSMAAMSPGRVQTILRALGPCFGAFDPADQESPPKLDCRMPVEGVPGLFAPPLVADLGFKPEDLFLLAKRASDRFEELWRSTTTWRLCNPRIATRFVQSLGPLHCQLHLAMAQVTERAWWKLGTEIEAVVKRGQRRCRVGISSQQPFTPAALPAISSKERVGATGRAMSAVTALLTPSSSRQMTERSERRSPRYLITPTQGDSPSPRSPVLRHFQRFNRTPMNWGPEKRARERRAERQAESLALQREEYQREVNKSKQSLSQLGAKLLFPVYPSTHTLSRTARRAMARMVRALAGNDSLADETSPNPLQLLIQSYEPLPNLGEYLHELVSLKWQIWLGDAPENHDGVLDALRVEATRVPLTGHAFALLLNDEIAESAQDCVASTQAVCRAPLVQRQLPQFMRWCDHLERERQRYGKSTEVIFQRTVTVLPTELHVDADVFGLHAAESESGHPSVDGSDDGSGRFRRRGHSRHGSDAESEDAWDLQAVERRPRSGSSATNNEADDESDDERAAERKELKELMETVRALLEDTSAGGKARHVVPLESMFVEDEVPRISELYDTEQRTTLFSMLYHWSKVLKGCCELLGTSDDPVGRDVLDGWVTRLMQLVLVQVSRQPGVNCIREAYAASHTAAIAQLRTRMGVRRLDVMGAVEETTDEARCAPWLACHDALHEPSYHTSLAWLRGLSSHTASSSAALALLSDCLSSLSIVSDDALTQFFSTPLRLRARESQPLVSKIRSSIQASRSPTKTSSTSRSHVSQDTESEWLGSISPIPSAANSVRDTSCIQSARSVFLSPNEREPNSSRSESKDESGISPARSASATHKMPLSVADGESFPLAAEDTAELPRTQMPQITPLQFPTYQTTRPQKVTYVSKSGGQPTKLISRYLSTQALMYEEQKLMLDWASSTAIQSAVQPVDQPTPSPSASQNILPRPVSRSGLGATVATHAATPSPKRQHNWTHNWTHRSSPAGSRRRRTPLVGRQRPASPARPGSPAPTATQNILELARKAEVKDVLPGVLASTIHSTQSRPVADQLRVIAGTDELMARPHTAPGRPMRHQLGQLHSPPQSMAPKTPKGWGSALSNLSAGIPDLQLYTLSHQIRQKAIAPQHGNSPVSPPYPLLSRHEPNLNQVEKADATVDEQVRPLTERVKRELSLPAPASS